MLLAEVWRRLLCRVQSSAGPRRRLDDLLQPRVRRRHVVGRSAPVRVARSLVAPRRRLVGGTERRRHGPPAGQRTRRVVAGRLRAPARLAVA